MNSAAGNAVHVMPLIWRYFRNNTTETEKGGKEIKSVGYWRDNVKKWPPSEREMHNSREGEKEWKLSIDNREGR